MALPDAGSEWQDEGADMSVLGWGRWARGAITATIVAGGVAALAGVPPAVASSLTVPAGSVSVIAEPGMSLRVPADGRLRNDGVTAAVTGYRFATRVGYGITARRSAPGQVLLVFGYRASSSSASSTSSAPADTLDLSVDGQQAPLPAPKDGSAPTYYLASVPAGARHVQLQLSTEGYTQSFQFNTATRVGPQPDVLYRSDIWVPQDDIGSSVTVDTPAPSFGLSGANLDLYLGGVYLTWFQPGDPATHPPVGDAYLVVALQGNANQDGVFGTYLDYTSTLTGAQVTLTLPGGHPLDSSVDGTDSGNDEAGYGISGGYYFTVPATLIAATVTVHLGTIDAQDSFSPDGDATAAITVDHTYSYPIRIPAPNPAATRVVRAGPDDSAAQLASASTATSAAAGSPASSGIPPWSIALLAVAAGVAAVVVIRRRRTAANLAYPSGTPTAASWPPASATPVARQPVTVADPAAATPPPTPHDISNTATGSSPSRAPEPPGWPVPPTTAWTPPVAPELPAGTVEIGVLGPPVVTGWPDTTPSRATVVELLAFLALHPERPWPAERLAEEVNVGRERPLKSDTIRTYLNTTRQALGAIRVPDATRTGYRLVDEVATWMAGSGCMDSREVGKVWDANAPAWIELSRAGYDVYRDALNTPAFLAMLPDVSGQLGLDLGCGEGHNTALVAERGAVMVGVDISAVFARAARGGEGPRPGIAAVVADGASLPFAEGSFDFVVAFMSLMDMPQPALVLAEAA